MKRIPILVLGLILVVAPIVSAWASQKGSYSGSSYDSMEKESNGSMDSYPKGEMAMAEIHGTQPEPNITGEIKFFQNEKGVKVYAHIHGVSTVGKHGFHIHKNGSCEDAGKAAGGHYNPKRVQHGFLPKDGQESAHAGDMGNIVIDEDGNGEVILELSGLSISDENKIVEHAIILHEKEDDFGQPTGHAGARIACGVIKSITE